MHRGSTLKIVMCLAGTLLAHAASPSVASAQVVPCAEKETSTNLPPAGSPALVRCVELVFHPAGDRVATARAARELRYWNARRASAQLAPPCEDSTRVHFGSTVTIVRDDGRRQTFRIVGEDEADPARGTLSHAAPLARALFGKSVGDVVKAGQSEAEIVEIA